MTTAGQLRNAGVYVPPHVRDHEVVDAIHFSEAGTIRPAVEEIAQRAAELVGEKFGAVLAGPERSEEIMTRAEAKAFVKRPSDMAFSRWCKRWRVKPGSRGRYSRSILVLALEREGGAVNVPATLRRHQESLKKEAA